MSSLIEVLVCLFILSLIAFGLDATQVIALRETKATYFTSVAMQQLNVFSEMLAANTGETTDEKLTQWNRQNQAILPQGRGRFEVNATSALASISWGDAGELCSDNKIGISGCLRRYLT